MCIRDRFQKRYPDVTVKLELPDSFIVIPMDSMLISQVLTNLLENAVLHAEGMTQLTLKVFTVGSHAVFEVTDNGCGCAKIEPGCGLRHMRERLRLLNGTLKVKSEKGFELHAEIPLRWGDVYD